VKNFRVFVLGDAGIHESPPLAIRIAGTNRFVGQRIIFGTHAIAHDAREIGSRRAGIGVGHENALAASRADRLIRDGTLAQANDGLPLRAGNLPFRKEERTEGNRSDKGKLFQLFIFRYLRLLRSNNAGRSLFNRTMHPTA